jgi:hypothetical protein
VRKPGGQRKHRTEVDVLNLCNWMMAKLNSGRSESEPRKARRKPQLECLKGALIVPISKIWRNETRPSVPALSHRLGTLTRPSGKIERHERRRHA